MNDIILALLGPGHINDLLLDYYKVNGASSNDVTDAEYEFLIAVGASPGDVEDMWHEYLTGLGYSGHINDMLYIYWSSL